MSVLQPQQAPLNVAELIQDVGHCCNALLAKLQELHGQQSSLHRCSCLQDRHWAQRSLTQCGNAYRQDHLRHNELHDAKLQDCKVLHGVRVSLDRLHCNMFEQNSEIKFMQTFEKQSIRNIYGFIELQA